VGKSTFLKTVIGDLEPLSGKVEIGASVEIGYFAQAHERLNPANDLIEEIIEVQPMKISEARNYLARYLFTGEDVFRKVETLSGGERGRLALAKLALSGANLLLLDEPTNHLDLETREALTVALAQFEGTLVLVSHDRHLLRATTDQLLIVADGRVQPFDGDLDDYRQSLIKTKTEIPEAKPPARKARDPLVRGSKKNRGARIKRLEELMARLNARKSEIESKLAEPATYQDPEACKALLLDQAYVGKELAQVETEWLELIESAC
jgi:ATP-binding cassette subfamily F protein 3